MYARLTPKTFAIIMGKETLKGNSTSEAKTAERSGRVTGPAATVVTDLACALDTFLVGDEPPPFPLPPQWNNLDSKSKMLFVCSTV